MKALLFLLLGAILAAIAGFHSFKELVAVLLPYLIGGIVSAVLIWRVTL